MAWIPSPWPVQNCLASTGSIAARFQSSQITPLLALVGLLLGVFAVLVTPREEEPQINVTFANVFIPFPGASAREVESLVASHGLDPRDLRLALQSANVTRDSIRVLAHNSELLVQAGVFLSHADEIDDLVVGVHEGKPVFLRDVATVRAGAEVPSTYVWTGAGPASKDAGLLDAVEVAAVTLAVAKKPGTNAVEIAQRVIDRFNQLEGIYIPDGIGVQVTRNYGATVDSKAKKLITKLVFATASVVLLVLFALGWREAVIVGSAVVVTLAATLFASWAWGFTLNRVSLFALIFSIGILVDDAIVVVENIHRHLSLGAERLAEAIPAAVDEVGGPTILATFTVIAALLPMAFVSGLMGPYMSPIPINASLGMLISLIVAFVFTPWMSKYMLAKVKFDAHGQGQEENPGLQRFFDRIMSPFLLGKGGWRNRWILLAGVLLLIALSLMLVYGKAVVLRMLPFDNKSEFQVVLDMPEGASLERTTRVLSEISGARGDRLPGLFRDRGTHQLQRAGASILSA